MIPRIRTHRAILLIILLFCPLWTSAQEEKIRIPTFKADVSMVFVKVAVSDPLRRYVTGLEQQDFKVYEDNVEQTISYFGQQAAPISVGILFDISQSMGYSRNMGIGKDWLKRLLDSEFLEKGNPEDEFFLITFNKTVKLVQSLTNRTAEIENDVAFQKPGGWTALYDAIYRGLDHIREAKNEKKALILITDGEDNSSRYKQSELREFCRESDVQVYTIGLAGPENYGYPILKWIVNLTGGRSFFRRPGEVISYDYFDLINAELRHQYLLGYMPSNTAHDGKWRRIKVKIDGPRGLPKLTIRSREGYYAPNH